MTVPSGKWYPKRAFISSTSSLCLSTINSKSTHSTLSLGKATCKQEIEEDSIEMCVIRKNYKVQEEYETHQPPLSKRTDSER